MANPHSTGTVGPAEVQYPNCYQRSSSTCVGKPDPPPYGKPPVSETTRRLAKDVRLLCVSHGWSQEVLAELADLNRSFVGSIERAEHNVSLATAEKIARAFDMSVAELLAPHRIHNR
jgi:DNA-binding XRE family transcriptional regulator